LLAFTTTVSRTPRPARRRRTREAAAAEILSATEELLAERTYHGLNVAAIMERTTLSRKSFYVYFPDVHAALEALVRPIQVELEALLADATRDPSQAARVTFIETARIFARHGVAIRALYEASSRDERVRALWSSFLDPAVDMLAASIRAGLAAGRITRVDPDTTARALLGLNHRTFFEQLAGRPDADIEAVVAPLMRIWSRTLYRADPEDIGWGPPR
jgi:TetR/AcrR family transcriptional regulator, ethionamide resistance regulator